ncbi:carboxymuconolactone decarboxylase family protein [Aquabacterium sp. J223]|uniref:carboxymuconolactone decarboxylase family protein n=1 Tax=Aquabacterium sp. J223 TaxID=2898431 RepID=UPI0021AE0E9C|nr:carboxymuconolactone decarboxylase family protein [Aquabacterium sp. J223]UUX96201.1 carboxymuconolactone decarboxylase family protein [Aquabacterium sp. J223]
MTDDTDRLPPLPLDRLDADQRVAADELLNGPRKAVKGPFIALLRSPAVMTHAQRLGAALRFDSVLPQRLNEFATLIVARAYSQPFEWSVHRPLAVKAGVAEATVQAVAEGRRPTTMAEDEALVHDYTMELLRHHGVGDATYEAARTLLGERGVVELTTLIGYFAMVNGVLNVARTPPEPGVPPMPSLPA